MNTVAGTGHPGSRISPKLATWRDSTTWKRGFSLVEMLAVIAVASVLLGIAVGVVNRAMRVERQWESEANVNRALARLAHDFRVDVHQSRGVILTENSTALELTHPDGATITYEIAEDEIIRDYQSPVADRRREFYAKPVEYAAELTIGDQSDWAILRVTRDPHLQGIKPRTVLHIEAEVGRLVRLTQTPGGAP